MRILGLDLETTGLDPEQDEIIEIGAVVWDTEQKKPLRMMSELVRSTKTVSAEITAITGITNEDLTHCGQEPQKAISQLLELAQGCQYIVAHNGREFDRRFLEKSLLQIGSRLELPWIDTLFDVPYSDNISSRKLVHLCAEHGFLNPFSHRAVFDVMSMLMILNQYDFAEVERYYKSPALKLVARVGYDDREKAKKAGFRWDPVGRIWFRQIKECQMSQLNFEFPTETVI
jgi:DNA polymerase-3 subunit epsilon